jgi:hypothetical protein
LADDYYQYYARRNASLSATITDSRTIVRCEVQIARKFSTDILGHPAIHAPEAPIRLSLIH